MSKAEISKTAGKLALVLVSYGTVKYQQNQAKQVLAQIDGNQETIRDLEVAYKAALVDHLTANLK